jgi:cell division septum initiation protein DivIVA
MSNAEAATALEGMHRQYRAFEKAADAARYMQGLEQNERELKERVDKAGKEADKAEAKAKERIDAAGAEVEKAEAASRKATDYAKRASDGIVEKANARAQETINNAEKIAKAQEARRADYEKAVIEYERRLRELQTAVRDEERRLSEVKAKVAQIVGAAA